MIKYSNFIPHINVHNDSIPLADIVTGLAGGWMELDDANMVAIHGTKFTNDNGKITFTGENTMPVLFIGTADVQVSQACQITFQLFKNGVAVDGVISVHDFVASAKIGTLAKGHGIDCANGDLITLRLKANVDNVTVSINTISLVYKG